ncbi:hypothetical protein [Anaerosacchariphilus polymeriproducens]|uniref:Acyl carrier protein n=1 Tax=Anaerosacchariphilus polymeriproducens TaxID=1812858 RepID=A0A371AW52_9FIRM|nr:hypothetical protein [Anaerosacchariphilus polymeriproducens]RDU23824.1 hypothetical protein DWV06_08175 [Anaerosacchariphilus polymeriproducens]
MDRHRKVKSTITKTIEEICGIKIDDEKSNLLEDYLGIILVDWLYILDELHRKYHYPVYEIIESMDCQSFTVEGLSKEISERI